jgi:hypothetical protein
MKRQESNSIRNWVELQVNANSWKIPRNKIRSIPGYEWWTKVGNFLIKIIPDIVMVSISILQQLVGLFMYKLLCMMEKGGMFLNLESSESDDELYNEWKNKIIRTSIAKSSLMRVKRINGSHFFTKGKVSSLRFSSILNSHPYKLGTWRGLSILLIL